MLALRKEREKRNWSLTKVCTLTGIDPANLSRIEREMLYPYSGWRKKLAKAFEMPEEELFRRVDDK